MNTTFLKGFFSSSISIDTTRILTFVQNILIMASVKNLKRDFNYAIFDIVEEGFSQQLWDESKTEKTNEIIDEAVDFRNEMIAKINASSTKAEFKQIRAEISDKVEALATKLM
ncbi:hypothetical protein SAMN05216474_0953 [Lishizhenia tianjinensis]|uniref:Uncharacterized protein n=2 Tax=Lishizhenia tianjinensis TaxID=477690 RepID=A0A1I6YJQ3_9FLAO|nr:hypothetical protein SAMN05216474_0953 [Lishizhenia tianjinensis]